MRTEDRLQFKKRILKSSVFTEQTSHKQDQKHQVVVGPKPQTDWNQDWMHAWGLEVRFLWADGVNIASYKVGQDSQTSHLKPGPW